MVNDGMKEVLKKYANQDGKLIITDDMPDDLKEAINYFNENNIDVFNTDFDHRDVDDIVETEGDDDLSDVSDEIQLQEDIDLEEQPEVEEDLGGFL